MVNVLPVSKILWVLSVAYQMQVFPAVAEAARVMVELTHAEPGVTVGTAGAIEAVRV